MPEAVIVATARSPIGRAGKGSLKEMRPDDLTVQMVRAALAQVPQLDPAQVDDLMLGCGQPAGEAGNNLARWTGIAVVSLNAIAQLLFIPAYPFWSLAIFTLDVLVIYGLAAYGGRPRLD